MNYNFVQKINVILLAILVILEGILLAMNNAIGVSIASLVFTMILCIAFGVLIGNKVIE